MIIEFELNGYESTLYIDAYDNGRCDFFLGGSDSNVSVVRQLKLSEFDDHNVWDSVYGKDPWAMLVPHGDDQWLRQHHRRLRLRQVLAHDLQLLDPQVERHETEDADTPGIVSEKVLGLFEQPPHGVLAQNTQSQKGQTPGLGHFQGEGWIVADPGHRPLSDRESGSLRSGSSMMRRARATRLRWPPES